MERLKQWIIVGIVALVAIIIVIILMMAGRKKRRQSLYSSSKSDSDRHSVQVPIPVPLPPTTEQPKTEVKAAMPQPKIMADALSAPILRCYDYFEFPQEGGFQVKTCSAPQREGHSIPSNAPKRIFLQWFPVEHASSYRIYANAGNTVDPSLYKKKWTVSGSSHYFESEELIDPVCWSVTVTSVNKDGAESPPSTIYSTCGSV